MVHDSSPCQAGCFESVAEVRSTLVGIERRECGGVLHVTDQMAREAHECGLGCSLVGAACLGEIVFVRVRAVASLEKKIGALSEPIFFSRMATQTTRMKSRISSALSEWPFWKRIGALSAPIFFSRLATALTQTKTISPR